MGEADEVGLDHWMDVFPPLAPFTRRPGTSLWTLTVELPERSRIEYKLSVKSGRRRRLILDQLNPRVARDPFGTNSVVTGPLYSRPKWSLKNHAVPAGAISELDVESGIFGGIRQARLYVPPETDGRSLPLLVAHDGSEYVAYAALAVVLDNMIAAGELPPLACLLTDPHDRNREYTGHDRHADHLVDELLPAVSERVGIDPTRRVVMGASLGGVASLHAARRHPGTFTGLILQSGSFVTELGGRHLRGPVFGPVVDFMREFTAEPGQLPGRVHVSCGRFDGLIAENAAIADRFRDLGADVAYEEAPDGHNWENWRDRLRSGLLHTLGH